MPCGLNVPDCVVALLLSWSRRRVDVDQTVDALGDGSGRVGQVVLGVGRRGIGSNRLGTLKKGRDLFYLMKIMRTFYGQ